MPTHKAAEKPLPSPGEIAKLPPDGGPEFNRLIFEKSPYLLQHARNPVDWYPWGKEAFEKARAENKPIFLSVGYSTCHWCHVMERESFERDDVAAILNGYYVSIKVDREERPDLDEIYMNATQLITGRGGWPNSVWLLPDGRPWYAGTYFPREDRGEHPGFKTILARLHDFYHNRAGDVEKQASQLAEVMKRISAGQHVESVGEPTRDAVRQALGELANAFDERLGGFGGAPKFPPHQSLSLLHYEYACTNDEALLKMAAKTLDAMALGGIHDHVGGGFHRYSTDAQWLLPHFEKMLYDNAQLARAYVDAYLLTKNEEYRRIAEDIFAWVSREMTDEGGGFYSALDADSEGEEGKFYVWTRKETLSVLGDDEGELFCRIYNMREEGNFRDEATGALTGANIPHLKKTLDDIARDEDLKPEELRARMAADRQKLLEARVGRVWPHLDDKILTSWNGLMLGSLAYAGRRLGDPRHTEAAEKAAAFILGNLRKNGRLLRTYRDGEAKLNAYLDDYAFLADGLLELYEATGEKRHLDEAKSLVDALLKHYLDTTGGGFFFTSDDHEEILARSKDPTDRAIPSGNGVAARALIRLAQITGENRYLETAWKSIEASFGLMQRLPRGTESMLLALATYFDMQTGGEAPTAPTKAERKTGKPDARARKKPVTAEAFASHLKARPGDTVYVAVRLTIDDGWHINSNKPLQDYQVPTEITVADTANTAGGEARYPEGNEARLSFSSEPLSVYEGSVWSLVRLKLADSLPDASIQLKLQVRFQACDETACLSPETLTLSIPLEKKKGGKPGKLRHAPVFESLGVAEPRQTN